MQASLISRFRHPRLSIEQGLPTCPSDDVLAADGILDGLAPKRREKIERYLDAVPVHSLSGRGKAQQEHLYGALSIIDAKAQSLLQFNSLLLAIVGIYFGNVSEIRSNVLVLVSFILTVLSAGASCLLCLDVIWLHWLSREDLEAQADESHPSAGYVELLLLRDRRSRCYRSGWLLSYLAVIAVVFGVIVVMVST